MQEEVVISWSGGKDSAMALAEIRTNRRFRDNRITGLLTTMTEGYDRVSGHGVRRELLDRQAASIGLDLQTVYIPARSTMDEYEARMEAAMIGYKERGIDLVAFGDIFLKDVKKRRLESLTKIDMRSCFPLWQRSSAELVRAFLERGYRAYIVCVDANVLDMAYVGRPLDHGFLSALPPNVDPCGENGEYHTFVFDGPIFSQPVSCRLGEVVHRESLFFADVVPT
jgi:uncharacterized protein (TIGR00290 family)